MRSINQKGVAALKQHQPLAERTSKGRRREQGQALQQSEAELGRLSAEQNREQFFKQIVPFLQPLKSYIKRRLRVAYLTQEIRTPTQTTGDLLDQVILRAYENYDRKPSDLTLEEWLYRLSNEILDQYVAKRQSRDRRRRSFESLEQAERSTLEEIPFTADADAEPWFPEDLDDSEYQPRDFHSPADETTPEEEVERREELSQILQALSRIRPRDQAVFDLYVVEGFSKEEVARILGISAEDVPQIASRVKEQVRQQLGAEQKEQKAS